MDIQIIPEVGQPANTAQIQVTKPVSEQVFIGSIIQLKAQVTACDVQIQNIEDKKIELLKHLTEIETRFSNADIDDITKPITTEQAAALNP